MELRCVSKHSHELILTAHCLRYIGTTSKITGFIAENNCYITDLQQFDDVFSNRFYIRCTFFRNSETSPSIDSLREHFLNIAKEENMAWNLHDCTTKMRAVIMVSKFDHCLNDLLYRQKAGELKMEVTAVVSNHPNLRELVEQNNIPYHYLPISSDNRISQERQLKQIIESTNSEFIILARYMQILSDDLCHYLKGRAINIHHSFLPGFKGARPYHQAHDRGVKVVGATSHYVTPELDEGPIIEQVVERIDHTYTPDKIASVGRTLECMALSRAVKAHLEHRIFLNGMKTVVFQ